MNETPDPVHGTDAQRWGGWSWREPSHGEHYRTCSYCGSINPEDLANEPTWTPRWADQKYGWPHKVYIDIPNRTPERLFLVGGSRSENPGPGGFDWIRPSEVPAGVNAAGWGDDWAEKHTWVLVGTRPTHHAKFYSVHLTDPQISADAIDLIQRISGVRFHFQPGRVSWEAYAAE